MSDDRPSTWKVVLAALLDFLLVFLVAGYLIAVLTGNTKQGGFSLNGAPAIALLVVIIAYFWGMKRVGGTLFQRLFGIAGKVR